ncbi:MAG: multiheme c-type cytochrome [Thermodesulfobacteriota bacterium]
MRRGRLVVVGSLFLGAAFILAGCGSSGSGETTVAPRVPAVYVGPERCGACHVDAYNQWKTSWHTLKATYGPAFEGRSAGTANVNPWVRDNWGSLKSHLILDQASQALIDANPGIVASGDLILTKRKYDLGEVAIVVGATRKQRYAVYYDGGPVPEAYVAYTTNGGIRYDIKVDPATNEPYTISFPGNRARAGYNFLFIEVGLTGDNAAPSANNYGEWRSWQERCIGCHTTGFEPEAWNEAKAAYVAGERADLKDLFVADIRISCESCHGPGAVHAESRRKADIIHPAELGGAERLAVCGQCHTRTQTNTAHGQGANDNRGFVLGGEKTLMEVFDYTRPAWGDGNRQVSIDGKGRRDHQQDMDLLLTAYVNDELDRGLPSNPHGGQACFDCHDAHGVGGGVPLRASGQPHLLVKNDPDGRIRLKATREQLCGACHAGQVDEYLQVLNGTDGWAQAFGWPWNGVATWNNERGRGDRKQHIFSTDGEGRSLGLYPEEYIWAYRGTDPAVKANYRAIWPWERDKFAADGFVIQYGAAPWAGQTTDGQRAPLAMTAGFAGPGACVACHKSAHNEWKKSWHTLKATYGPAFEGRSAGTANINPWVRDNWDALLSHLILDQASAGLIAANPGVVASGDLILTKRKYNIDEVAIVVGATRKQRYAVYYDGGPVEEAYVAYTTNGGIRYDIKMDPATGEPYVISYPGNRARAGYNFLFIEIGLTGATPAPSSNNYGEFRSWQERCIGCHTTGFDPEGWKAAKEKYVAGDPSQTHLKDLFVADIRVSCESCHGPGAQHAATRNPDHVIHPADLTGAERQAVCSQCHTRTQSNTLYGQGANDNRGFVLGGSLGLMDVFEYTRPAWGDGNRQVSIDGKGRRDHQQDMDILLTDYIRGGSSLHGSQACFDCHNAHGVGSNVALGPAGQEHLLVKNDPDGLIRLSAPREQLCGSCHFDTARVLDVLNGTKGWTQTYGWPWNGVATWNNERGRGDRKQHIFATDREGRSFGLHPAEYLWAYMGGDRALKASYRAIWPWEAGRYAEVVVGEAPWLP